MWGGEVKLLVGNLAECRTTLIYVHWKWNTKQLNKHRPLTSERMRAPTISRARPYFFLQSPQITMFFDFRIPKGILFWIMLSEKKLKDCKSIFLIIWFHNTQFLRIMIYNFKKLYFVIFLSDLYRLFHFAQKGTYELWKTIFSEKKLKDC